MSQSSTMFMTPSYTPEQQKVIDRLEGDLYTHMYEVKPKRFAHSISVGHMAETMALVYDANPFYARIAGILHDWDKVLSTKETLARARACKLDMGGAPYQNVVGLIHGPLAACELPKCYPWLPQEVLGAISKHTTADLEMSDLDKIVYVADLIEPGRPEFSGIAQVRDLFRKGASLGELYQTSFMETLSYVVASRKYLYPKSVAIYNAMIENTHAEEQH